VSEIFFASKKYFYSCSIYPQKGGVEDILRENSRMNSDLFRTMGYPARRRVATQIYHDNVHTGDVKLRRKDIPECLQVFS
jgi:hypothetical protein